MKNWMFVVLVFLPWGGTTYAQGHYHGLAGGSGDLGNFSRGMFPSLQACELALQVSASPVFYTPPQEGSRGGKIRGQKIQSFQVLSPHCISVLTQEGTFFGAVRPGRLKAYQIEGSLAVVDYSPASAHFSASAVVIDGAEDVHGHGKGFWGKLRGFLGHAVVAVVAERIIDWAVP